MLQIPAQLANQFKTYIGQQGIPSEQHRYYLKWIRYFLDFPIYQRYWSGKGTCAPRKCKQVSLEKQI